MNNSIIIESSNKLNAEQVQIIKNFVQQKFKIEIKETIQKTDLNLIGGILVNVDKFKIVISNELLNEITNKYQLVIETAREFSEKEKETIINYSLNKFPLSKDVKPIFIINNNISSGLKIRFNNEEIDLTLDKIIQKVFSNI